MPSSTQKQAKFMRAIAHGWKPDNVKAPPVSVAKEFMRADERQHKAHGGVMVQYVQKNMPTEKEQGPGPASLVRCPHCSQHFYAGGYAGGGAASPERRAKEFDYEHGEAMGQGARTRSYDKEFRHYYSKGERGFARGGMAHLPSVHGLRSFLDESSRAERNFAKGGEAYGDSFSGYLAKRRAARGSRDFKGA